MDERLNRVVSHDGMVVGDRSCWGGRSRGHWCGFWVPLLLKRPSVLFYIPRPSCARIAMGLRLD